MDKGNKESFVSDHPNKMGFVVKAEKGKNDSS